MQERERKLLEFAVEFVLGHYEAGGKAFQPTPVDPETWWSKMQLASHDPAMLLPRSRAHFEARVARWKELVLEAWAAREPSGG